MNSVLVVAPLMVVASLTFGGGIHHEYTGAELAKSRESLLRHRDALQAKEASIIRHIHHLETDLDHVRKSLRQVELSLSQIDHALRIHP